MGNSAATTNGLIPWLALAADCQVMGQSHEFMYFEEFVLAHVDDALGERLLSADAVGSHNLRVSFALARLKKYLALAVHAHWEPNFRRWFASVAAELHQANPRRAKNAPLDRLMADLEGLRGVAFDDVPGGSRLRELALVANVVRHGDGVSAERLFECAPHVWLGNVAQGPRPDDSWELADDLTISSDGLRGYASAVSDFWLAVYRTYGAQRPGPVPPWEWGAAGT